jgi:hypothetical protein
MNVTVRTDADEKNIQCLPSVLPCTLSESNLGGKPAISQRIKKDSRKKHSFLPAICDFSNRCDQLQGA